MEMIDKKDIMNENLRDDILLWTKFFQNEINKFDGIDDPFHRELISVVMLDTFSKCLNPAECSQKKRYVEMIEDFSGWDDSKRVSLPQLSLRLAKEPYDLEYELLRKYVCDKLEKWENSGPQDVGDVDPTFDELQSHIGNSRRGRTLVEESKHSNLFYMYRCYLVHEFRRPSTGVPVRDNGSSAYYIWTDDGKWSLVYPISLFKYLCSSILDSLQDYLTKNKINPYDSYNFSSIWKHKRHPK